ncbi:hypothetical protein CDD83_5582 [Cordyceps sp. RAO-2017]|nr:hypothetical protein CDD83_5582 [Cordyceps sp. RAO-2017]
MLPSVAAAVATPSNIRGVASLQDLRNNTQSPPADQPPPGRQLPATSSASGFAREPLDPARLPPRSMSARPDVQRPHADRPRRPTLDGGDPRIVHSDTQGPLYRGRDGTLYPEMRVTREPDPRASYFPVQTGRFLEPGAVISAGPLKDSHFNCYQHHRTMNRRPNRHYPLTCQTCDRADADDRWACTFCHLRICDSCMRLLNGHQRVLRRLVDELALNTPLSLSSMSRPGSALGLQVAKAF